MPKKSGNLVIVESPTKATTIEKYLGSGYTVRATVGHIRDLPKRKLGVDIEHDFEPEYVIPKDKQKVVKELKALVKKAENIYIATDGDREGEAIAYHVMIATDIDSAKAKRLRFFEITKPAILEAMNKPHELNEKLVHAQQARRILDRLVGYKISPLLGKRLSAGRVQSAALKMIIDRERERMAFKPVEYYDIGALLSKDGKEFEAKLAEAEGKKVDRLAVRSNVEADSIASVIKAASIKVTSVELKDTKRNPSAPFITSTLQREAANKLGMNPGRAMRAAQGLYEGKQIDGDHVGLITYMRTDSLNIAESAITGIRALIEEKYGKDMLSPEIRRFKKKVRGAQEAHEAIRPTHPHFTPEKVKGSLSSDEYRIYKMIWERTIATQMAAATIEHMVVRLEAGEKYVLEARGERIVFPGFISVYMDMSDTEAISEHLLPKLAVGDNVELKEVTNEQKFTEPPARYNSASLIKALEDNEIGRPSTYAMIIDKIVYERSYVSVDEGRLVPQLLGFAVNEYLEKNFPDVVDLNFTATMEGELDEIAEAKIDWHEVLKHFWEGFSGELEKATYMPPTVTDIPCNKCDNLHLELKSGPFGPYLICAKCGFKTSFPPKIPLSGVTCPLCGKSIYERKSKKRGRLFYGCAGFPECRFVSWDKPTHEKCPDCGNILYEKGKKLICKHEGCGYTRELPKKDKNKEQEEERETTTLA